MFEWLTGRQKIVPQVRLENEGTQRFLRGLDLEDTSGIAVRHPYVQNIAAFRCISTIATSLADVPFKILKNGKSSIGAKGDAVSARLEAPNPLMDWNEFITTVIVQLLVYGNAFIYMDQQDSNGVPIALMPIPGRSIRPQRGKFLYDLLGWEMQTAPNTYVNLGVDQVIHIMYAPNPDDPVLGVSPMIIGQSAFETDHAAALFNKNMLSGGGLPSGLLKYTGPGKLSEDMKEEVRQSWKRTYGGPRSSGNRLALTSGDWTYQSMGVSHKDMEYLGMRKYNTIEIARLYNVPLIYLNEFDGISNSESGLNVLKKMFFDTTLIPLGTKLESSITNQLLSTIDKSLRAAFDYSNVDALKDDFENLVVAAQRLQKMGFTINSINRRLKLGLDEMPWGDEYFLPMNMTTAQDVVDHNVVAPGGAGDGIPGNNPPSTPPSDSKSKPPVDEKTKPPPDDARPADTTQVTTTKSSYEQSRWLEVASEAQAIQQRCEGKLRRAILAIRPKALAFVDQYLETNETNFEFNRTDVADSLTPYIIEAYNAGIMSGFDETSETRVSSLVASVSRGKMLHDSVSYADKRYSKILELIEEFATSIKRHVKEKSEAGISDDDIRASLKKIFNEFINEAGRIAKMEIFSAINTARYRAISETSSGEAEIIVNPRRGCLVHQDGQKLPLGLLRYQYEEVSDCDCIITKSA